jgi:hypothetical protein
MDEKIQPNIAKALVECQKMIKAAGMSGKNEFDKYKYSNAPDIIEAIKPALEKNNLAISFDQRYSEKTIREVRETSQGKKEQFVGITIAAILIHESGESIVFTGQGDGQDRSDKALYKALTGAQKYLLRLIFNLPCKDDPEDDSKDSAGNDFDQRPTQDRFAQTNGKAPSGKGGYTKNKPAEQSRVTDSKPSGASQASNGAPEPSGDKAPNDADQKKAGLLIKKQVEVISGLYKQKNISRELLSSWLQANYACKTPWGIKSDKFQEVCNTILQHPEKILEPFNNPA